jgi:hypothetical protein
MTSKSKRIACGNHEEESKKKERHIVTWTQQVINRFLLISFFAVYWRSISIYLIDLLERRRMIYFGSRLANMGLKSENNRI